MEIVAGITTLLGIIALVLKAWYARQPQRTEEKKDEAIQNGRSDIAAGDTDHIAARIDRLLPAAGTGGGDPAGEQSAEDIERRISRL